MKLRCLAATLFVFLLDLSPLRAAGFAWPGHGTLQLDLPADWTLQTKQASGVVLILEGHPKSGVGLFQFSLLDLPPDKPAHADDLKARLVGLMQPYVSASVEGKLTPQPLTMAQGSGWYAQLTDASLVGKPPAPDNYKMMRNALLLLDEHALAIVSMQFGDATAPAASTMLAMIGTLRFERSASTEPVPPAEALTVRKVGDTYELSVAESDVVLKIPANGLVHKTPRLGGSTDSPRYFELVRSSPNLIISGWFEPAERYKGDLQAFWAGEVASMKKSVVYLPPQDVQFGTSGDWHTVTYATELPGAGATNTHLRAELTQSGTWIDLHLSITAAQPIATSRAQLLAALAALQVAVK